MIPDNEFSSSEINDDMKNLDKEIEEGITVVKTMNRIKGKNKIKRFRERLDVRGINGCKITFQTKQ